MSMLSGQIDELRLMGDGQAAKGEFTVATLLREAADTIESLRDRLQGGTCEWILEHSGTLYDKWRCSKCGYLYVDSRTDGGATDFDPRFCPNCGKRCVHHG